MERVQPSRESPGKERTLGEESESASVCFTVLAFWHWASYLSLEPVFSCTRQINKIVGENVLKTVNHYKCKMLPVHGTFVWLLENKHKLDRNMSGQMTGKCQAGGDAMVGIFWSLIGIDDH